MARDLNSVIVTGNLTADPVVSERSKGDRDFTFCDFSVAVNAGKDSAGEDRPANFFDVTVFGQSAKACGEHLSKGRHVTIQGELRLERWNDKESGDPRRKVKIAATMVKFGPRPQGQATTNPEPVAAASENTDDIPF